MPPTVVRESRAQAGFRLVGCLAFVSVCLWALRFPRASHPTSLRGQEGIAWMYFAIAFFGILGLRYAWTLLRPGTLTITDEGISQNLGWRRRRWAWHEISRTEVLRTAANLVSVCLIHTPDGEKVRLFGWEMRPEELQRKIDEHRGKRAIASV